MDRIAGGDGSAPVDPAHLDILEGMLGKVKSLTHWRRLRSGSTPSVVFRFLFYSGQSAARMMLQVSRLEILGTLRWKVSWLPAMLPQKVLGVAAKDVSKGTISSAIKGVSAVACMSVQFFRMGRFNLGDAVSGRAD